ncbi:MAG TPA: nuclear transport factor 2 family protein [Acidimicrobiales bacterium]
MGDRGEHPQWGDVVAIQQLVLEHCDTVTRGDWDRFEAIYVEDAVWEESAPLEGRAEGARAIRERSETMTSSVDLFLQVTHGTVVTLVDADHATARSPIRGFAVVNGRSFENHGIYYDQLVRTAAGWRFQQRYLQNLYVEEGEFTGALAIARADIR